MKDAEKEVKYLIVADRLDNLLDLEKDLQQLGEQAWDIFNAPYEKQKWYNESIAKNMYVGLAEQDIPPFFEDFEHVIQRVFD